jgi:hypothetical protein
LKFNRFLADTWVLPSPKYLFCYDGDMENISMSKQALLLKHLSLGKEFTAKQIAASFGLAHPASTIRTLREQGYAVYSNKSTLSNGTETTKYRLGKPSRKMVQIANAVMGASVFTN